VKLISALAAAAYTLFPDWWATTVHAPEPISVSVFPLKVHMVGVLSVKVTARPELADAETATVPPTVCVPVTGVTVMVCGMPCTVKPIFALTAAAYSLFPDWWATTVHVPEPISVSVVPLKVHVAGVLSVNVTGRPELADAEMATEPPTVCVPVTGVTVMVCARPCTVNLISAVGAAV